MAKNRKFIGDTVRLLDFFRQYTRMHGSTDMTGIGLEVDGDIVAGVLYESFNGHNVWMHIQSRPGALWATKEFIFTVLHYPFVTMGCGRVSAHVNASNYAAQRFLERVGFRCEAVLSRAADDGGDVNLYVMWREDFQNVN
jgi:RimJ/RimL family protein N-acetyltransferase